MILWNVGKFYNTVRCHIPEDYILLSRDKLKSHNKTIVSRCDSRNGGSPRSRLVIFVVCILLYINGTQGAVSTTIKQILMC
jgi:hypothetical protein